MQSVRALGVVALVMLALPDPTLAAEPKSGGILRIYHRDSPGSASIHEGATYSINVPFMPVYQQSRHFRPAQGAEQRRHHPAGARGKLGLERRRQDL